MLKQLHKVVPLRNGRVLKLIDENVLVTVSNAFVDISGWIFADDGRNFTIQGREQAHVAFFLHRIQFGSNQSQNPNQTNPFLQMLEQFKFRP